MSNGSLHDKKPSGKSGGKARTPLPPHQGWSRYPQLQGGDERTLVATLTHLTLPSPGPAAPGARPLTAAACACIPCTAAARTHLSLPATHPDLQTVVTAPTFPLVNPREDASPCSCVVLSSAEFVTARARCRCVRAGTGP